MYIYTEVNSVPPKTNPKIRGDKMEFILSIAIAIVNNISILIIFIFY